MHITGHKLSELIEQRRLALNLCLSVLTHSHQTRRKHLQSVVYAVMTGLSVTLMYSELIIKQLALDCSQGTLSL